MTRTVELSSGTCVSCVCVCVRACVRACHARIFRHICIVVFTASGICFTHTHAHTHTRLTALFSGATQVGRYQKGKTNLDFTDARDSEWQWLQLGDMQVCTSLQTDNHASTPPPSFLQAGCSSGRRTNSVKARKASGFALLHC